MKIEKIQAQIEQFSTKNTIDTIQGAIYKAGQVCYISNKVKEEPFIFEFASVTKIITAFAISLACDEGKLALHTTLKDVFKSKFNVNSTLSDIQIGEILTHASGLPNLPEIFLEVMKGEEVNPYNCLNKQMVFDYLTNYQNLGSKKYQYSNFGYGLLGIILEQIYAMPFEEIIQKNIFQKIGMINSSFNKPGIHNVNKLIQGHSYNNAEAPIWENYTLTGGGGLLSTTEDFIRFLSQYFSENNYSNVLNNMLVIQNKTMAIGWHRQKLLGRLVGMGSYFWHNGVVGGSSSYTAISKKEDTALIVLANKGISIDSLGFEIISYL
jgi:serine-type D-Ala-D-Ala carboxypeptidase/endopeptidase